jgi:hypothetical protein
LASFKSIAERNAEKYDKKVDARKQADRGKYRLDEIAQLLNEGKK